MKFKLPRINKQRILEVLKKRWGFFILEIVVFAGLIALDLTMKDFLYDFLLDKPLMTYTLIPGFLDLFYTTNTGAGFGTLKDNTLFLTVITAIVVAVILFFMVFNHKEGEGVRIPLVLIAAGGIGNLVDRIALGYVRDYFEFTFVDFAIFNVADICVTVGAILLIISLIVIMVKESKKNKKDYEQSLADAVNTSEETGSDSSGNAISVTTENNVGAAEPEDKNAFTIECANCGESGESAKTDGLDMGKDGVNDGLFKLVDDGGNVADKE